MKDTPKRWGVTQINKMLCILFKKEFGNEYKNPHK
jgi:hypothetical protein